MNMTTTTNSDSAPAMQRNNAEIEMDLKDAMLAALMLRVGRDVTEQIMLEVSALASTHDEGAMLLDAMLPAATFLDVHVPVEAQQAPEEGKARLYSALKRVGFRNMLNRLLGDDFDNVSLYTGEEAAALALVLQGGPLVTAQLAELLDKQVSQEVGGVLRGWAAMAHKLSVDLARENEDPKLYQALEAVRSKLHPDWRDIEVSEAQEDTHDAHLLKKHEELELPELPAWLLENISTVDRAPQRNITIEEYVTEQWPAIARDAYVQAARTSVPEVLTFKLRDLMMHKERASSELMRAALYAVESWMLMEHATVEVALEYANSPYVEATGGCRCDRCRVLRVLQARGVFIDRVTKHPLRVRTN
jgi:hypothetical protein